MVHPEQEQDATTISSSLLSCCDFGPLRPSSWHMVVLVHIWHTMAGHMEVLQPFAQLHRKKHRVESEGTNKGSRDVINEEKVEFVDDMMGLRFSLVGSLGHCQR